MLSIKIIENVDGGRGMEIKNLITFVRVAEQNSFTKAAQILGYSQSTVSFQIKQLETELNSLLFERINHTIVLTQSGKELLSYAQEVCKLTDEFKQNMSKTEELEGYIHIVTPDSVCEAMLLTNYRDFYGNYPKIALKFSTADTTEMFHMLDHNEADIMMTLDTHIYQNDYVIAKEEPVRMHFVTNAKSPLVKRKDLLVKDIIDYPFFLTEKSMGYRRLLDRELAKQSIEISPALEVGRTDIITRLLEDWEGISFLPDFITEEKVKKGSIAYLDVCDVEMDIWKQLIYHKNKWISKCMRAFIEYVKEMEFA